MSILFSDIYTKAIALFDDPAITSSYKVNDILFYKKMHTFLQNAIAMFNNPLAISIELASFNEPNGVMETFSGDGEHNTFKINFEIDEDKYNNKKYAYNFIEEENLIKCGAFLEKREDLQWYVTFPDVLPEGCTYAIEQYYIGEFTSNFEGYTKNGVGTESVKLYIKDILARLLVKSWAEGERNLLLDIRGIMQDSDFKLLSSDRILRSKNEWIDQLDSEIYNYQNRLAWQIRFMNGSRKIGRG